MAIEQTQTEALQVYTAELMQPESDQPAVQPWYRQPGEPSLYYQFFKLYCKLDIVKKKRSLYRLCKQVNRHHATLGKISSDWNWIARAEAYDAHLLQIEDDARERAAIKQAQTWELRRETLRNSEWEMAEALIARAKEMLQWPLFREVIENNEELTPEGMLVKTYIIKEPTSWTLKDAASIFELASKLGRLSTGMETSRARMRVDLNTLSDDELKQLASE